MEFNSLSITYPSVGRCIYCGARPPDVILTQEHIIPVGLWGYLKLPGSSCNKCANITSKIEYRVLRVMLGPARIHLGPGFRRKEKEPTSLDGVYVDTPDGNVEITLPIADHPFLLTMFDFEPPGILRGTTETVKYEKIRVWLRNFQGDTQARVDRLGAKKVRIVQTIVVPEFFRMLAKVAHSFACATVGVDSFEPFLLDIILGRKTNYAYLVGGADDHLKYPDDNQEQLHSIWLNSAWVQEKRNDRPLIVCAVQLFSCFNAPTYQIVVGRSFKAEN